MNKQATKRRGPILWLADFVRRRPALAALLAALLMVLGVISAGTTMYIWRRQRLIVAQERAQAAWRQQQALSAKPAEDAP